MKKSAIHESIFTERFKNTRIRKCILQKGMYFVKYQSLNFYTILNKRYLFIFIFLIGITLMSCVNSSNIFNKDKLVYEERINPSDNALGLLEKNGFLKVAVAQSKIHYSAESFGTALLPAITAAKKSIFIIMFVANSNEFTKEIFEALIKKADEGVAVYFLFDGTSYQRIFDNPSWSEEIVAPSKIFNGTKVHWAEFNPLRAERVIALPQLLIRDHRKLVMIDGFHIFTGGYNINIYSFAPLDKNGNVDAMVEIKSFEAGQYLAADFVNVWNKWSAYQIKEELITPNNEIESNQSEIETIDMWLGNQDLALSKKSLINTLYQIFFHYSHSEVWLIQALSVITSAQMKMIQEAINRGVKVNLMLSEDQFSSSMDKAAKYMVLPLLDAGASVYMYKSDGNALLHYKLIMADKKIAALGSPNFNLRSMYLSNEIALVFQEANIINSVVKNLESLKANARLISRDEASQWRGLSYLMSYLVSIPGG